MLCLVLCVWCVCVWCDTLKKPVCPLHTSPCVRSIRLRVYRHHAQTCFNMFAWCRLTRRRIERTHGDVLNQHTEGVLYIHRGQRVIVSSAYQNLPTYGLSRASEVHQRNPWILHILRNGRAQSLNAPLLPVAMYSSYETGTLFRPFVQRPSRHFFLALSSSIFLVTTQ